MAVILPHPAISHPAAVKTVRRRLASIHAALQTSQQITEGEAQQILAEAFVEWAAEAMATDVNPEASARALCREILCASAQAIADANKTASLPRGLA